MGRIQLDTLSQLARHGYWVRIICRECGHAEERDPAAFMMQLAQARAPTRICELEHRLKCKVCARKAASIVHFDPEMRA